MGRKRTETVQVGLRLREDLRRLIERSALKNGVSLNREMVTRLERSFSQENVEEMILGGQHGIAARLDVIAARLDELAARQRPEAVEPPQPSMRGESDLEAKRMSLLQRLARVGLGKGELESKAIDEIDAVVRRFEKRKAG